MEERTLSATSFCLPPNRLINNQLSKSFVKVVLTLNDTRKSDKSKDSILFHALFYTSILFPPTKLIHAQSPPLSYECFGDILPCAFGTRRPVLHVTLVTDITERYVREIKRKRRMKGYERMYGCTVQYVGHEKVTHRQDAWWTALHGITQMEERQLIPGHLSDGNPIISSSPWHFIRNHDSSLWIDWRLVLCTSLSVWWRKWFRDKRSRSSIFLACDHISPVTGDIPFFFGGTTDPAYKRGKL